VLIKSKKTKIVYVKDQNEENSLNLKINKIVVDDENHFEDPKSILLQKEHKSYDIWDSE
jgi:hypothetical protein